MQDKALEFENVWDASRMAEIGASTIEASKEAITWRVI
jgi:hypothetical protein